MAQPYGIGSGLVAGYLGRKERDRANELQQIIQEEQQRKEAENAKRLSDIAEMYIGRKAEAPLTIGSRNAPGVNDNLFTGSGAMLLDAINPRSNETSLLTDGLDMFDANSATGGTSWLQGIDKHRLYGDNPSLLQDETQYTQEAPLDDSKEFKYLVELMQAGAIPPEAPFQYVMDKRNSEAKAQQSYLSEEQKRALEQQKLEQQWRIANLSNKNKGDAIPKETLKESFNQKELGELFDIESLSPEDIDYIYKANALGESGKPIILAYQKALQGAEIPNPDYGTFSGFTNMLRDTPIPKTIMNPVDINNVRHQIDSVFSQMYPGTDSIINNSKTQAPPQSTTNLNSIVTQLKEQGLFQKGDKVVEENGKTILIRNGEKFEVGY